MPDVDHEHDRVLDLGPRVELPERPHDRLEQDLGSKRLVARRRRAGSSRTVLRVGRRGASSEELSVESCSTMGPSASAGKNVRPPMITMTPISRPTNMVLSVRNVPRPAGTICLPASEPASASAGIVTRTVRGASRPRP